MSVILWTLTACSFAGLAFWLVVWWRVRNTMRREPTIRAGLALPAPPAVGHDAPAVSVVVPVHNEERLIESCVTSLRRQTYAPLQLVFVLDRCTDGTRAILDRHAAEDPRIVLVVNDACPDDWAGKCHAARCGAEHATGVYLLFTDADTIFDPDLVRAAVNLAHARGLDLLSLLSTLTVEHTFERIVQPVASMNLVRMFPIRRVNRADGPRPFANGQFMLFTRARYEQIGGHAAVKDDLLEDIAFARAVHKAGGRGGIFLSDGMLVCSMYDSLAAFRTGWKRIFIEACKRRPGRLRKNAVRVLVSGIVLPIVQAGAMLAGVALIGGGGDPALGAVMIAIVGAGWAVQIVTLMRIYALGGAPRSAALLFPIGCWVVAGIMLAAARDLVARRPIPWAGKQYVLEPR